jgi:aminoglycoside phosphotransferase family enzyme/predicted kinase
MQTTEKTLSLFPLRGGQPRADPGALVRDLLRPEAYPPPAPSGVELRHTHASWVFLTDGEAWKVKRPVDYGFLDFSTAEKRRRCCEEEVRLGRRLAPDVYLGVAPLHAGVEGHSFAGAGPVVDHAVRMRRLPDEDSASVLLASGQLGPRHLERLAARLARFYAEAPRTPALGAPAVLAGHMEENHAQCLPWAGRFVDAALLERLHDWQRATLAARRALLAERAAAARDGHGDLRLEHVYFEGGDPEALRVIDPIEFNPRLRCADPALDVAFLAMDLDANHRPELAAWFLSSFARASNDYDFYPVVDLYLSHRAWVRAKVACFVAADPRTAPAKVNRKAREAAAFLTLAASYLHREPSATPVIAVGGAIGAGKTTLAQALGLALEAPVVSSDLTRKHLGGIAATATGGARLYTAEHTRRTYAELCRRAAEVVASGRGVILDATFPDPETRAQAEAVARRAGRPFRLVELDCDDRILQQRLGRRLEGASVSDARADLLTTFRRGYRRPGEVAPQERVLLDGALPVEQLVSLVRAAL